METKPTEFEGFDWDSANEAKIWRKHGIDRHEVERFFRRDPLFRPDQAHSNQETRWLAAGLGDDGRPMLVSLTLRVKHGRALLRPISARRMHQKEADAMSKQLKPKLDLSGDDPLDQDLSAFIGGPEWRPMRFVLAPKDATVTLRLPSAMVQSLKKTAQSQGVRYQGLMRELIADGLRRLSAKPKPTRR